MYAHYADEVDRLRTRGQVVIHGSRAASEEELARRLEGADVVLTVRAYTAFTESLLSRLPDVRLISVVGTGTDNIDLDECTRRGIVVANAPGATTASVAELTLALILSLARNLPLADRRVREGEWFHRQGIELRDKVLGVVGLGLIGQEVVRLARGLG